MNLENVNAMAERLEKKYPMEGFHLQSAGGRVWLVGRYVEVSKLNEGYPKEKTTENLPVVKEHRQGWPADYNEQKELNRMMAASLEKAAKALRNLP